MSRRAQLAISVLCWLGVFALIPAYCLTFR